MSMYRMICTILQYDTIYTIHILYHTIHKRLRYADMIQNFLHMIWYISRIVRYRQLWAYHLLRWEKLYLTSGICFSSLTIGKSHSIVKVTSERKETYSRCRVYISLRWAREHFPVQQKGKVLLCFMKCKRWLIGGNKYWNRRAFCKHSFLGNGAQLSTINK